MKRPNRPKKITLRIAQQKCELALQQLEKLFKPHCQLTLLMRNPESDDGDLLFSKDDLVKVEAAVARLRSKGISVPTA